MAPKGALCTVLALLVWAGPALAEVVIDGVEKKGDFAEVRFTYRNDTNTIYSSVVIECFGPKALRRTHRGVRYLRSRRAGGIGPGFTASASVRVPLMDAEPDEIKCTEGGMRLVH
jgi:hypothetical protein